MFARRYTVVIADRSTGVVRRVTISLRAVVTSVTAVLMLPVLIGLGARWSALAEIAQLRATNATLDVENSNFRANTGELTAQIQSLEERHQRFRHPVCPRSRSGARAPEAAGGGEGARRRRHRAAQRPDLERPVEFLDDSRRHLRRPADAAPGARRPPQLRAARRRTAGGAGRRAPVDLADLRLAHRHASAAVRIPSPASEPSIRASTLRRRKARRSTPRRTGRSTRQPIPVSTGI